RTGRTHVGVKAANDFGGTGVKFGAFAETVKTGVGQFIGFTGEGGFVHAEIVGEEIVQGFLAGIISGVFENFGTEIVGETHDFKEMAVAITGEGGDAHARENFAQAGVDGRAGFLHAARFQRFGKLIREIGDDGAGTGGDEQGYVMRVKNLG